MAISNSIGSNVFDILVGLGLPWALQTLCIDYGSNVSASPAQPEEILPDLDQNRTRTGTIVCNVQRWAAGELEISAVHKSNHTLFVQGALCSLSPNTEMMLHVNWSADYFSHLKMKFEVGVIKVTSWLQVVFSLLFSFFLVFKYF